MDPNKFIPFDPVIWGTVSDWVMVTVTAITAIYLYKTFQSQLKITKIEELKYRLSVMPNFDINRLDGTTYRVLEGQYEINLHLEIKLVNNNPARVLFFYLPDNTDWTYSIPNQTIIKNFNKEDVFNFVAYRRGPVYIIDGVLTELVNLTFNLEFADELNNQYIQTIDYYRMQGMERFSISTPKNNGMASDAITQIINN